MLRCRGLRPCPAALAAAAAPAPPLARAQQAHPDSGLSAQDMEIAVTKAKEQSV